MARKKTLLLGTALLAASLFGGAAAEKSQAETISYSYDALGQLTRATYGNGSTAEYVYDMRGNGLLTTVSLAGAPANTPPNTPSGPNPAVGATGVPLASPALSWTGGDPDAGDVVAYDVFFGTTAAPPLVSSGRLAAYTPGQLKANTKYYWKVTARDGRQASTAGPLWDFTTKLNAAPALGAFAPGNITSATGSSTVQLFSAVYQDADGVADLRSADFLVSPGATRSTVQAIWASYDRGANRIYLYNDFGSATVGSCVPGVYGAYVQNTQGRIDCYQTSVVASGTTLSIQWAVAALAGYDSITPRSVWLRAVDNANAATAWVKKGSWKIVPSNSTPILGALSPNNVTSVAGSAQLFTAVYTDAEGFPNLKTVDLQVSPYAYRNDSYAIWATYNRNENRLYLAADVASASAGNCVPGSAVTLQNTQGTLNCAQTTATPSGRNLTMAWSITPKAAFASATARSLWMTAADNSRANAAWTNKGQWTVTPPPGAPFVDETRPFEFSGGAFAGFLSTAAAGVTGAPLEMSLEGDGTVITTVAGETASDVWTVDSSRRIGFGRGAFGRVSADGQVIVFAQGDTEDRPGNFGVAVRKGQGLDNASLAGTYRVLLSRTVDEGTAPGMAAYDYDFDGVGLVSITERGNLDHAQTSSYGVDPDGRITVDGMVGQLDGSGRLFVLAAQMPAGVIGVGVRPVDSPSLTGDYGWYGIQFMDSAWRTIVGRLAIGATGDCRLALGAETPAGSVAGPCSSGEGGTVELSRRSGIISQDGTLIVLPDAAQGVGVFLK